MTLTNQEADRDIARRDFRVPRAWLAAGEPQCECPDFCSVEHDNDN